MKVDDFGPRGREPSSDGEGECCSEDEVAQGLGRARNSGVGVDGPEVDGTGINRDEDGVCNTEDRPAGCVRHSQHGEGEGAGEEDTLAEVRHDLR